MEKTAPVIQQTRRSFLKLSGLLGLGAMSTALLPVASAEALLFSKDEYKVTKTRMVMGTFVSMTAIHPSRDEAEQAIGLAFAEIDRLNALLTRFATSSAVGNLNASGKLEKAPGEIIKLISRSLYFYHETKGAFDITVKPLLDLYKTSFDAGQIPAEKEIDAKLKLIGSEKLILRGDKIEFMDTDMSITLDGIAKGYIVDRASHLLQACGISNHLINAGGDIRTCGSAAKGRAWRVAVEDPEKSKEYPQVISLRDGAIATSGNYEIYYDREKIFHHIVNGQTGLSPQISTSVTVTAPTVMEADALSTSVFVMEPVMGIKYINSRAGCECFVIAKDGSSVRSMGWHT